MRRDYLDGLRGWASLFVLFSHLGPVFLLATAGLTFAPFFMDGQLAVYIFFVLSGYVLSIGFFETGNRYLLTSLALRRYPRLTVPILASCGLAFFLVQIGAMQNIPAGLAAKSPWLEMFYNFPTSFMSMLKYSTVDVYFEATLESYNAVLWTMQYELLGSFLVLGGLYLLDGARLRIAGYLVALTLAFHFQSPLGAFVFGMALADLSSSMLIRRVKPYKGYSILATALLATALYIAMFRLGFTTTPFGLSAIAACIIGLIGMIPFMRQALSSPLSLWLGRISFPLYLTHLLVICSVSSWAYLGMTKRGYTPVTASVITALLTVAVALGAAMLFAPVESFAIRLSRNLSNAILPRKPVLTDS